MEKIGDFKSCDRTLKSRISSSTLILDSAAPFSSTVGMTYNLRTWRNKATCRPSVVDRKSLVFRCGRRRNPSVGSDVVTLHLGRKRHQRNVRDFRSTTLGFSEGGDGTGTDDFRRS